LISIAGGLSPLANRFSRPIEPAGPGPSLRPDVQR
jgi:hypothetical protein